MLKTHIAKKKIQEARKCVIRLKKAQQVRHAELVTRIIRCLKPGVTPKKCGLKKGEMKKRLNSYNFNRLKPFFT